MQSDEPPPERPNWLTGFAAEEWDRVIVQLARMGVTPLDAMTLAAYCKAYALWRKVDAVVEEDGPTVVDANGNVRAHPAAKVCIQLFAELRRMAAEFGFSPAARSRIDVPRAPVGDEEDFDAFCSPRPTGTDQV